MRIVIDPPLSYEEFVEERDQFAAIRAEHESLRVLLPIAGQREPMLETIDALVYRLAKRHVDSFGDEELDVDETMSPARAILITDLLRTYVQYQPTRLDLNQKLDGATARLNWASRYVLRDSGALQVLVEKRLEALSRIPEFRDKAIEGMRERVAARRELLASSGMNFLLSLRVMRLAETLTARGTDADFAEAHGIIDEVLVWRRKVFGAEHPLTLVALSHHIRTVLRSTEGRRWPKADLQDAGVLRTLEAQAQQLLDARLRVLGTRHPAVLISQSQLARILLQRGRYRNAIDSARRAISGRSLEDELSFIITRVVLAAALALRGEDHEQEESISLLETAVARLPYVHQGEIWLGRTKMFPELYREGDQQVESRRKRA